MTAWADSEHASADRLELPGVPAALLLDREGRLLHTHIGFKASKADALRDRLEVAPTGP